MLNTHAPKKVKILRGNHKPHYNKNLRKAIMKRSRLKNKANRSKDHIDIANYKKQRNLVVSLNHQAMSKYFDEVSNTESSRPFWKTCKAAISDSLYLYEFPDVKVCEGLDDIDNIVYKFRNHPSIIKIKERYKVKEIFHLDLLLQKR